jgi:hypothetical protein
VCWMRLRRVALAMGARVALLLDGTSEACFRG